MHEASAAGGLLNLVLRACRDNARNGKVPHAREIICHAGLLSCFEAETLNACFQMLAEGTEAENAVLTIKTEPLACVCRNCGHKFELMKKHFVCPACGAAEIVFQGGHGLILQAINVDGEDNDDG